MNQEGMGKTRQRQEEEGCHNVWQKKRGIRTRNENKNLKLAVGKEGLIKAAENKRRIC